MLDGETPANVPDTMLTQAHDIGAAVAKLDAMAAAHEAFNAAITDAKGVAQFALDRVGTLETTIASMAEDIAKLKPAAAVDAAAQGASDETTAAIDAVTPPDVTANVATPKKSPLNKLHDLLG